MSISSIQPKVLTDLPTDADFAGGVRSTIYNTEATCLLDQDPSDNGYRRNLPEENVRELFFSTNGYCISDNPLFGSDIKFISCERNSSPSGDANTFVVKVYSSTDGSCSGSESTVNVNKNRLCKRKLQTFGGLGNGYLSWTCF